MGLISLYKVLVISIFDLYKMCLLVPEVAKALKDFEQTDQNQLSCLPTLSNNCSFLYQSRNNMGDRKNIVCCFF